ncbi:MAG: glutaminase A [Pirellulales bacterium]
MTQSNSTGALDELLGGLKSKVAPFRSTLNDLHAKYRGNMEGKVADYIPELALADPNWFAISVVTVDGQSYDVGDHEQIFSIQSVSKPFMFGLALDDHGREEVLSKVGVEPTGEAFNAIVLDEVSNRPFNPLVNAGAIATADLVRGKDFADRIKRTLAMFGRYIGREVYIDNAIFLSERTTGHRNRAISHLMLNFGMVSEQIPDSLELYFQQCSIMVNAHDLAVMGATLANAGVNPVTKERAIERRYVKDVLSIMLTCGMYDYAGEWAYRVGLPAKSGVGGGICAVVPGRAGIGIFSPLLDARGNSVRGIKVCEELSQRFGLHSFELGFDGEQIDEQFQLRRNKG